jgi:hypothetical protein
MAKRRRPLEAVTGPYVAMPHAILDSAAYRGASHAACALLVEVARQLNGSNNGHLQLTTGWLRKRGWSSADTVQRAKQELLERRLMVQTRQGGLNIGASQFAVTWLPITNYTGLDLRPQEYHPGAWHFMDKPPTVNSPKVCSDSRNSSVPVSGTDNLVAVPEAGTKTAPIGASAVPAAGNNVCIPLHSPRTSVPAVGKKGRSGVRASTEITPQKGCSTIELG